MLIKPFKIKKFIEAEKLSVEVLSCLTPDDINRIVKFINPNIKKYKGNKTPIISAFLKDLVEAKISTNDLVDIMNKLNNQFNQTIQMNLNSINNRNNPPNITPSITLGSTAGSTAGASNTSAKDTPNNTGTSQSPQGTHLDPPLPVTDIIDESRDDEKDAKSPKKPKQIITTPGGTPALTRVQQNRDGLNILFNEVGKLHNNIANNMRLIDQRFKSNEKNVLDSKNYLINNTKQQTEFLSNLINEQNGNISKIEKQITENQNKTLQFLTKLIKKNDSYLNINSNTSPLGNVINHNNDNQPNEFKEETSNTYANGSIEENDNKKGIKLDENYYKNLSKNNKINETKNNKKDYNSFTNAELYSMYLDEDEEMVKRVILIQNSNIPYKNETDSAFILVDLCNSAGIPFKALAIDENKEAVVRSAVWKNHLMSTIRMISPEDVEDALTDLIKLKMNNKNNDVFNSYQFSRYENYSVRMKGYEVNKNNKFNNDNKRRYNNNIKINGYGKQTKIYKKNNNFKKTESNESTPDNTNNNNSANDQYMNNLLQQQQQFAQQQQLFNQQLFNPLLTQQLMNNNGNFPTYNSVPYQMFGVNQFPTGLNQNASLYNNNSLTNNNKTNKKKNNNKK